MEGGGKGEVAEAPPRRNLDHRPVLDGKDLLDPSGEEGGQLGLELGKSRGHEHDRRVYTIRPRQSSGGRLPAAGPT